MILWVANQSVGHVSQTREITCPLCRHQLHTLPCDLDRELLRCVTNPSQWFKIEELIAQGAKYSASINTDDYVHGQNVGMMPLHFVVRDQAPFEMIRGIYEAYPMALRCIDQCGLTPLDLLSQKKSPNAKRKPTKKWHTQVKNFLESKLE